MANQTNNPYLNPIKFSPMTPSQASQYLSKFMDDYRFKETIHEEEQDVNFCQCWTKEDAIRLQFRSNYGPIVMKIFDVDGTLIDDHELTRKQQDFFFPDFFIWQSDYDTAALAYGQYQFQMHFGADALVLVSEPQRIVTLEQAKDTVYQEYSNYEKKGGLWFQVPFSPCIRVPGRIYYKEPGSIDSWYQDEYLNPTMNQSIAYDVYRFILGGKRGVPPWLIKKDARIVKLSAVKYDGRLFTVATENQVWEAAEIEDYPMKGWSIDLRESLNKDGMNYDNEVAQIGMNSIIGVTDTKGFGYDDAGGDFTEFSDVE